MSNNKFMLRVKLKQHTPIIHFQHDQEGATLRASEVKPKLDRFIVNDLKNVAPQIWDQYKHLLTPKYFPFADEKFSSSYKLRTIPLGAGEKMITKTFFSNREKDEIPEYERFESAFFGDTDIFRAVHFPDGIEVSIFSFIDGMAKFIEKVIPYFFAFQNFGCRQSKGFGGFLVDKTPYNTDEWLIEQWQNHPSVKAIFKREKEIKGYKNQLASIKDDYQLLKSGQNHGGYVKSSVFDYMVNQNIRWEKRRIKKFIIEEQTKLKRKLFAKKHKDQTPRDHKSFDLKDLEEYNYKFSRALLGLAEQHEYLIEMNDEEKRQFERRKKRNPNEKEKPSRDKYVVQFKHQAGNIARFESPLKFKVINNQIYALAYQLPNEIFDEQFEVKVMLKLKNGQIVKSVLIPKPISTPQIGDFDFVDFLNKHFNRYQKV